MMAKSAIKVFLLLMLSVSTFIECKTTPIHSHKREKSENDVNKERVDDGAYSPRRHLHPQGSSRIEEFDNHIDGDEHHSEFDHEAILGSRETAEEFDSLLPEEAKKRLVVLATSMDVNKDKEIDRDELIQWILSSFKSLNKEDSEERHEESDTNADGFVTWEEYLEENYGLGDLRDNSDLGSVDSLEEKKMITEDQELFVASDLNGDGKLSRSEFLSFTHPEEYNYTSDVLIRRLMVERDLDKDGYLSLQEYYGIDGVNKNEEWKIAEKDKFDDDYDLNRDGRLGPEEVLRWLSPDDRESAEQEADHLIESADDNRNGRLDMIEISDHHDIFVGSEATDYGQALEDLYLSKDEL
ncbi:hypothetical protein CHUAL_004252 [Chamberlinius hualienensis]